MVTKTTMSINMRPEHCCSKYQNRVQFHPWWNTTECVIDNVRWKRSVLYTIQDLRDENLNAFSCNGYLQPLEEVLSIGFSLWITDFIGSNNKLTFDFKAVLLKYSEKAQRLSISTWNPGCSASIYRSYTQGQILKSFEGKSFRQSWPISGIFHFHRPFWWLVPRWTYCGPHWN